MLLNTSNFAGGLPERPKPRWLSPIIGWLPWFITLKTGLYGSVSQGVLLTVTLPFPGCLISFKP